MGQANGLPAQSLGLACGSQAQARARSRRTHTHAPSPRDGSFCLKRTGEVPLRFGVRRTLRPMASGGFVGSSRQRAGRWNGRRCKSSRHRLNRLSAGQHPATMARREPSRNVDTYLAVASLEGFSVMLASLAFGRVQLRGFSSALHRLVTTEAQWRQEGSGWISS